MRGKRKLYVHIGPPKTGTTSIQHMLHVLAPSLEQCGMHVVVASADHGNHWHLIGGVTEVPTLDMPGSNPVYQWKYVRDELVRCSAERFVLSSERCAIPDARRGVIRELSLLQSEADIEVEVVALVRPQWQWAESYWCQSVASGFELRRFEECVGGWFADTRLDYNELDYNQLFEPWRDSFGKVTVRPLETSQLPRGLLVRFLGLIGVHDERLFRAATRLRLRNPRLGAKDLEVRRLVGVALARHGVEPKRRASLVYGLGFTSVLQGDWPFAGWTREQALAFDDLTAESNARFARDYGIDDGGVLFRDELPEDFDRRGRPASWDDLSVVEQRAVRRHVIRELDIDIDAENGWRIGNRPIRPPSDLPIRSRPIRRARWLASQMWNRGKLLLRHAWRLTRAMAQIRLSTKGLLFARWVRWEAYEFWRRQFGTLPQRFRRTFSS